MRPPTKFFTEINRIVYLSIFSDSLEICFISIMLVYRDLQKEKMPTIIIHVHINMYVHIYKLIHHN